MRAAVLHGIIRIFIIGLSISSHLCTPFQLISLFLVLAVWLLGLIFPRPAPVLITVGSVLWPVKSQIKMSATATFVSTEINCHNIQEEPGIQTPGLVRVQLNERRSSFLRSYSSKLTAQSLVGPAEVKNARRVAVSVATKRTSNGILMAWIIDYSTGLINPTVNIRLAVRNKTGACFCSLQAFWWLRKPLQ